MSNYKLPPEWHGYSWKRGRLVSPEGREYGHEDLRWLSLTVGIKHEWTRMMDAEKQRRKAPKDPKIVYLREVLAGAREKVAAAR